jgi:hypothetical protein
MTRRRWLLALLALVALTAAACGDSDSDDSGDAATDEAADETTDDGGGGSTGALQVTEIRFENSTGVLTNTGDEPIDLAGHWLCNRPTYVELSGVIEPGESKEVGLGGMTAEAGELAVYTSQNFGNADDLVTYVHWAGGGGRAETAAEAGLWSGDPATAGADGLTLTGEPGSAAGWTG